MIEFSSLKSIVKLSLVLEPSENLSVFEYAKKNRRLMLAYGMC